MKHPGPHDSQGQAVDVVQLDRHVSRDKDSASTSYIQRWIHMLHKRAMGKTERVDA